MKGKLNAVRDVELRVAWARERGFCQACGVPSWKAWPPLAVHHICKFKRSDERCNFLLLCGPCHSLCHGARIAAPGGHLPQITLGVMLALKALRDPAEHDPARLAALYGRPLPDPVPIPSCLLTEYHRWRPWDSVREDGSNGHARAG